MTQHLKSIASYALMFTVGAATASAVLVSRGGAVKSKYLSASVAAETPPAPTARTPQRGSPRTVWQLLALSDEHLEQVDVVELNLAVAREIPGLEGLNVTRHQHIVDQWAEQIAERLAIVEPLFSESACNSYRDLHQFRLGQMAWFMHNQAGIEYVPQQQNAEQVIYNNPEHLFLHGLTEEKLGTCGNMSTLYVAIGRRLGWPVSLAAVESHTVCRFDNGEVVYNVEASHPNGAYAMPSDEQYLTGFGLTRRAVESGSDLRSLSAREMLGYFIALRARHFRDTGRWGPADRDYALARSLYPEHRETYKEAMWAAVLKGMKLYEPDEAGHPFALSRAINTDLARRHARPASARASSAASPSIDPTYYAKQRQAELARRVAEQQQQTADRHWRHITTQGPTVPQTYHPNLIQANTYLPPDPMERVRQLIAPHQHDGRKQP